MKIIPQFIPRRMWLTNYPAPQANSCLRCTRAHTHTHTHTHTKHMNYTVTVTLK